MPWYPAFKRLIDVVVAVMALVGLAPLFAVVAVGLWLESGRPVFFLQERVGRHGAPFRILKFRTLVPGRHDPNRPDLHTTDFGRLLRKYAVDELPQLLNVVRGEMSLIGPRPIFADETAQYTERERLRLAVRPGLTGWAQVNGRNAIPWYERVALDVWYVEHLSPWLDLRIALRTPLVLASGKGVYGTGNHNPDARDVARHRQQARVQEPGAPRQAV